MQSGGQCASGAHFWPDGQAERGNAERASNELHMQGPGSWRTILRYEILHYHLKPQFFLFKKCHRHTAYGPEGFGSVLSRKGFCPRVTSWDVPASMLCVPRYINTLLVSSIIKAAFILLTYFMGGGEG